MWKLEKWKLEQFSEHWTKAASADNEHVIRLKASEQLLNRARVYFRARPKLQVVADASAYIDFFGA